MTKAPEKQAPSEPEDKRETVMPKVNFLGFPFGGRGLQFQAKIESVPIPSAYAQLLRDKNLVANK